MKIEQALLNNNASSGRNGKKLTPKGVVVHYVGNPNSTAIANRNYFNNQGNGVSAHYIVGLQGEIICCVPENEIAGHAGKSYAPYYDTMAKTNNSRYLGVETCHPNAGGMFSDLTYESLIWLLGDICTRYNFNPKKDLFRHYDVTGKMCPIFYVKHEDAWEKLKQDVANLMKGDGEMVSSMKVTVNGKEWVVSSIVKDGQNYPNLRELAKILGVSVDYDNATKTVVLTK